MNDRCREHRRRGERTRVAVDIEVVGPSACFVGLEQRLKYRLSSERNNCLVPE